jgi:acyl-CoA thioesterase
MANFITDTAVEHGDGQFLARIDPEWCVWSPNGGYLIAIALRAAQLVTVFPRPLSLACHFLSVPAVGDARLTVTVLRRARTAESLLVSMFQQDRAILSVMLWAGEPVSGYEHTDVRMPDVPPLDRLTPTPIIEGLPGFQSLWKNLEHRPCGPLHWERNSPADPRQRDWVRLRDFNPSADAFIEAGRYSLLLDAFTWPAAAHAHVGDPRFIAPTLSLSIDFHRWTESAWLLSDAHSPRAHAGTIAIHNRVWSPSGDLLATANATLLCRPRPAMAAAPRD